MNETTSPSEGPIEPRTIKSLINTPLKRVMLVIQIVSYVLIPGSPIIGGAIGGILKLTAAQSGGVILGVFILGEIMFYLSLAFLGKEIVLLIRDKIKSWFKKKKTDEII
jgi:hypothetical protein